MAISLRDPLIEKYMDCSTGHITWEDNVLLPMDYSPLTCYTYNFGVFVFTHVDDRNVPKEDALKFGFSKALIEILEIGSQQECNFIRFDCDGKGYEELPTFEWPQNNAQAIEAVMVEPLDIALIMSRLNDPVALSIIEQRLKKEEQQAWATMRTYRHEVIK